MNRDLAQGDGGGREDMGSSRDHAPSVSGVREPAVSMTKFSAQINFTMSNGYGSKSGVAGSARGPVAPEVALISAIQQLSFIAARAGMADAAVDAMSGAIAHMKAVS